MSKFKPGDRVYKRGTVIPTWQEYPDLVTVQFDGEKSSLLNRADTLKPLKKRGKLVGKWETKIGTNETGWPELKLTRDELSIHTMFVGKRVEVTVRLIEENEK